jgi:DNA-binding transcriptional MerR regulator
MQNLLLDVNQILNITPSASINEIKLLVMLGQCIKNINTYIELKKPSSDELSQLQQSKSLALRKFKDLRRKIVEQNLVENIKFNISSEPQIHDIVDMTMFALNQPEIVATLHD